MTTERYGDLSIVLHSHMPYVEGFGTYPFGEEWLFDAVARSYLPLLEVVRDLTMTVTPVLADQLEAAGVMDRLGHFVCEHRRDAAAREAELAEPDCREAARAEGERYRRGLERLDAAGGDLIGALRALGGERGVTLIPSSATHAVLPLLATRGARALQIDAGIRSHRRRFGPARGFWLPECAYAPGLEALLAERGVGYFCVDQSAHGEPLDALRPVLTDAGPVAFPIDWETVELVWSWGGYPADPVYADFHRKSLGGIRLWAIGGGPYDPARAARRAREQAEAFVDSVAARLAPLPRRTGPGRPRHVRDRHRAARTLVVGGADLARAGDRARARARRSACSRSIAPWPSTSPSDARSGQRAGARARTSRPGTRARSPISPGAPGGSS